MAPEAAASCCSSAAHTTAASASAVASASALTARASVGVGSDGAPRLRMASRSSKSAVYGFGAPSSKPQPPAEPMCLPLTAGRCAAAAPGATVTVTVSSADPAELATTSAAVASAAGEWKALLYALMWPGLLVQEGPLGLS